MNVKTLIATAAALAVMGGLAPAAALADAGSDPSGAAVLTTPAPGPQGTCGDGPIECPLPEPSPGCPGCPLPPKPHPCEQYPSITGMPQVCNWPIEIAPHDGPDPATQPGGRDVRAGGDGAGRTGAGFTKSVR